MLFWIIQGLVFPKVRLGLIILENMDTNKIILQMLLLNMQNVNFSMLLYTMLIKHTGQEEPFLTHCLILTKFSKLFKSYDYNGFFSGRRHYKLFHVIFGYLKLSLLKSLFICLFTLGSFWNFLEPFEKCRRIWIWIWNWNWIWVKFKSSLD